jgi:hypothetical protein
MKCIDTFYIRKVYSIALHIQTIIFLLLIKAAQQLIKGSAWDHVCFYCFSRSTSIVSFVQVKLQFQLKLKELCVAHADIVWLLR